MRRTNAVARRSPVPTAESVSPLPVLAGIDRVGLLSIPNLALNDAALLERGEELSLSQLLQIRRRAIAALGCEIETETWRKCKRLATKLSLRRIRETDHGQWRIA